MGSVDQVLKRLYYDPSSEASFSAINKLYHAAKKQLPSIKLSEVKEWLDQQDTYRRHRFVRRKFPRLPIVARHMDSIWQADLMDVSSHAKSNDGVKFILVAIDVLSRKAFVEPLTDRTSIKVRDAFMSIFNKHNRKPRQLEVDQGNEWDGNVIKKMFFDLNIIRRYRAAQYKATIAERMIRTVREKIHRYMTANETDRYIDKLPHLIASYNKTHHRMLKLAPDSVNGSNEKLAFNNLYADIIKKGLIGKPKFKVGDLVNRRIIKGKYAKGATPNFEKTIYQVAEVDDSRPPRYVYRIKNTSSGQKVPEIYYSEELTRVNLKNNGNRDALQ